MMRQAFLAALLGIALTVAPARATTSRSQVLLGARVAATAEAFVRSALGTSEGVHAVYQVPDRFVPAGPVSLQPNWPSTVPPPNGGFTGRTSVTITIVVNRRAVQTVPIMVEVGTPLNAGVASSSGNHVVARGSAITVFVLGENGLRVEIAGIAQDAGSLGEHIHVELQEPRRILLARVVNASEATLDDQP